MRFIKRGAARGSPPLHWSYNCFIFPSLVFSPFRSAISHAPRSHQPTPDDPVPGRRPGTGRPHSDAKVTQVRRLIETTTYSYLEIARRIGVPSATVARWSKHGKWPRPLFAPRATDTV